MTQIKVTAPDAVNSNIILPSSKSISNRVLIINALGEGKIAPSNLSDCDDTKVMINALDNPDAPIIDIKAAGTAMRFLTAYLAVTPNSSKIITGTERMQNRPISILVDALRDLGAEIQYANKEGFPPLKITGKIINNSTLTINGNTSSQYISALLMIGAVLPNGLRVKLQGEIISKPYINLTIELMKYYGATVSWEDDNTINVSHSPYISRTFYVESDWSAASYWYEIVSLANQAEVKLPLLFMKSYQGDSKVADIFNNLGVETIYKEKEIILRKSENIIDRLDYDFKEQPDLAQTFAVTCSLLNIPFCFTGLQSLKIKETDRIKALITEMKKLGYVIKEKDDSVLFWDGERCCATNEAIDTYEDHRMALAFAPASLKIKDIRINQPEVVTKSYPHYWEDLKKAGFIIEEEK